MAASIPSSFKFWAKSSKFLRSDGCEISGRTCKDRWSISMNTKRSFTFPPKVVWDWFVFRSDLVSFALWIPYSVGGWYDWDKRYTPPFCMPRSAFRSLSPLPLSLVLSFCLFLLFFRFFCFCFLSTRVRIHSYRRTPSYSCWWNFFFVASLGPPPPLACLRVCKSTCVLSWRVALIFFFLCILFSFWSWFWFDLICFIFVFSISVWGPPRGYNL